MGLRIKEKNGKYQVIDTISDYPLHDSKHVTFEEDKSIIITDKLFRFFESIIELDMDFPNHWRVNDQFIISDEIKYNDWVKEILNLKDGEFTKEVWEKGIEVLLKSKIKLEFI